MNLDDILTPEEIEEYQERWDSFPQKHEFPSEYHVHSNRPVIGKAFQYSDELFRAHVFQNKLRQFDPYFTAEKYVHPIWHAQHYLMVMEQTSHASADKVRDNNKWVAKDLPRDFNLKEPIYWDQNISVQLIRQELGKRNGYEMEKFNFTFYDETEERAISRTSLLTFWQPRAYIQCLNQLKEGNRDALYDLIRKIESQENNHERLKEPREFGFTAQELITALMKGNIPEEELHDYFSLWDQPNP